MGFENIFSPNDFAPAIRGSARIQVPRSSVDFATLINVVEAARRLGRSRGAVRSLVQRRRLGSYKMSGKLWIVAADVDALLSSARPALAVGASP